MDDKTEYHGLVEAARMQAASRQWDTYVRMTEGLIDRRAEANRFYLGLNTAIVAAGGFVFKDFPAQDEFLAILIALPAVGIFVCLIWRSIIASHRRILASKFPIIHELEDALPSQPYKKEWLHYKDPKRGKASTGRFEQMLPSIFVVVYFGFLVFLVYQWFSLPIMAFVNRFL